MPKVNDLQQFILMERQQRNNLAAFNLLTQKNDPVEELRGYLNSDKPRSNIFHIDDLRYGQPTESDLKRMILNLKLLKTSFNELSIPKPFKNSSDEVDIELKFVRMLRKLSENPETIQDIEDEDKDLLSPFLRFVQAKHLPIDETFLRILIDDINALTMRFKYMFNRPRPKQLAAQKNLELVAHDGSSAHSPSYPSGHAVAGRVLSRALGDRYPEFAEDFERIGAAIGLNRLIAGLHYPTDHAAGVMLGNQIYSKGLIRDHTNFMMPESEDIVRAVQQAVTKHAEGFNLNKSIDDVGVLVDIFKAKTWEGTFRGELEFLSNYSPSKVGGWKWNKDTKEWESDGKTYPTAEHAYQAGKFDDDEIREAIRTAKTPGQAKRLGGRRGPYANRNIIDPRDGSENSPVLQLMEKVVTEKFSIPELRTKLEKTLETHPELEESNNWGDSFWGKVNKKGTNHLGKILTKVRGGTPQVDVTDRKVTVHSGGAEGSDDAWAQAFPEEVIGHSYKGHRMSNRTNQKIWDNDRLKQNFQKYLDAYSWIKSNGDPDRHRVSNPTTKKLMGRNWEQVRNSDAVIGIIEELKGNAPTGGTSYAVVMGIQKGIPVHVFNQETDNWLTWNPDSNAWDETSVDDIPHYKNFAGVGTRQLDATGKAAIQAYAGKIKTFQKGTEPFFASDTDLPGSDIPYPNREASKYKLPGTRKDAEGKDVPNFNQELYDADAEAWEQAAAKRPSRIGQPGYLQPDRIGGIATGAVIDEDAPIPDDALLGDEQRKLSEELRTLDDTWEDEMSPEEYDEQRASLEDSIADIQAQREERLTPSAGGGEGITVTGRTAEELGSPESGFEPEQTKAKDLYATIEDKLSNFMDRTYKPSHYLVVGSEGFRRTVGQGNNRLEPGQIIGDDTPVQVSGILYDAKTGDKLEGEQLIEYLYLRNSNEYDDEDGSMVTVVHRVSNDQMKNDLGLDADAELTFENFEDWVNQDKAQRYPRYTMDTSAARITSAGGNSFDVGIQAAKPLWNRKYDPDTGTLAQLRAISTSYNPLQGRMVWEKTPEGQDVEEVSEAQFEPEALSVRAGETEELFEKLESLLTSGQTLKDLREVEGLINLQHGDIFESYFRRPSAKYFDTEEEHENHVADWLKNEFPDELEMKEEEERISATDRRKNFREKYAHEISTLRPEQEAMFDSGLASRSWNEDSMKNHLMFSAMSGAYGKGVLNEYAKLSDEEKETAEKPNFREGQLAGFLRRRYSQLESDIKNRYNEDFKQPTTPEPPTAPTESVSDLEIQEGEEGADFEVRVSGLQDKWDDWNTKMTAWNDAVPESGRKEVQTEWENYNNRPPIDEQIDKMRTDIFENPEYFAPTSKVGEEKLRSNYAGQRMWRQMFLSDVRRDLGSDFTNRYNVLARQVEKGDFKRPVRTAAYSLSQSPVYLDDIHTFASLLDIDNVDAVFSDRGYVGDPTENAWRGEGSNQLSREGKDFFRSGNFSDYAPFLSGLAERRRALEEGMQIPLDPQVMEGEEYDPREAREDAIQAKMLKEVLERADNTKFKDTYGRDTETLKAKPDILRGDIVGLMRDDFINSANNATSFEKDDDGNIIGLPLFSAPGGGVRRLVHNPKLRMHSIGEQQIDRNLITQENHIINTLFPNLTRQERFGENRPGGGQGLEGRLEDLKENYWGEKARKNTKEEQLDNTSPSKYNDYLDDLTVLLTNIRDEGSYTGEILTVPTTLTEEDPKITERYDRLHDQARGTPVSRKGRKLDVPKTTDPEEAIDVEEPISQPRRGGVRMGEQRIDIPIRRTTQFRSGDPIPDEGGTFDPYATIPPKEHETASDIISSQASRAKGKYPQPSTEQKQTYVPREGVVTDPSQLTPMTEVPQTEEKRQEIAESKAKAMQQGTENAS